MVRLNARSLRMLNQDGASNTIRSVEGFDHVGAFLREARETTERSVANVARALRIRQVYLEAIEDGRFDELPGTTYAVGFVRSYATYLRLDASTIVERFKQEATGIEDSRELEFPAAGPEGRFPGGVVVTLCIILAGAGFAGWYWWQNQSSLEIARVPSPPEALISTLAKKEQVGDPTPTTLVPEVIKVPSSHIDPAIAPLAVSETLADVPPKKLETVEVAAVKPIVPETPTVVETVPEVEPPAPFVLRPTGSILGLNVGTASPPGALASQIAGVQSTPSSSVASEDLPDGRTYGTVNRNARVILRARDSGTWVQVMDGQENALLTQMLQSGDQYLVPDRPGLRLRTNNAGGLDILVDGAGVPTIGSRGDVRHDVRLDPELLKSGAAVIK
jgi:cytoskeleton protein RodZ